MGNLRNIIRDRWSGGVIAVFAMYVLLLQAFFGAMGSAAMAAAHIGEPAMEICFSHDVNAGETSPDDKKRHDCPCGLLCRVEPSAPSLAVAAGTAALSVANPVAKTPILRENLVLAGPREVGLSPDVRGPPRMAG